MRLTILALQRTGLEPDELESLIIDATESTIERPSKNQKPYYSGKKRRHTLKTEYVLLGEEGSLVYQSQYLDQYMILNS